MYSKQKIGKWGENLIVEQYRSQGYAIIARNFRCRAGEIDILCSRQNTLYSIEVKTRLSRSYGYPEEAITARKRERMIRCTNEFLATTNAAGGFTAFVLQIAAVLVQGSIAQVTIYTDC